MTNEEAINRIKWKYQNCDGCARNQEDIDTWTLCIEALEKQIPMKPELDILNVVQPMYCPNCGSIIKVPQPYCCWCGQAIDWSD